MDYFTFIKRFPDERNAVDLIIRARYGSVVPTCPRCGNSARVYRSTKRISVFHCNACKSEFSVLSGTVFERTRLPLRKWLFAINLFVMSRKGVSACQLQRELGLGSYKTAWRMLHKIRERIDQSRYAEAFNGEVEIDETYVGGKPRWRGGKRGRGTRKIPVVGMVERESGRARASVSMPDRKGAALSGNHLLRIIEGACAKGSRIISDQFGGYSILDKPKAGGQYMHSVIDHSKGYSDGKGTHTNRIEGFWAFVKRALYGIYHHVSRKWLGLYLNEFCFRSYARYRKRSPDPFNMLLDLCVD